MTDPSDRPATPGDPVAEDAEAFWREQWGIDAGEQETDAPLIERER